MGCHGLNAVSGLIIPDLRGSAYLYDLEGWHATVRDGARREKGMAAFGQWLNEEQSSAIRDYIIQQAHRGKGLQKQASQ
jgi:mono/diheme cytochrome c family protein